jgi:hypothetical protein
LEAIARQEVEEETAGSEKRIVLSVVRTYRPPYKSVHRTWGNARKSVLRTYIGCFSVFPKSVQRTPSSNTTPYTEGIAK